MKIFHIFTILVFLLLAMPFAAAEFVVQQAGSIPSLGNDATGNTHTFIVNKYNTIETQEQTASIMIQQIVSQADMSQCSQANFSFKMTNLGTKTEIYGFSIEGFDGTAFITPNVMMKSKESKIINYILKPDCSIYGDYNPKILVENQESTETALIPVYLNISKINFIEEDNCLYYYNQGVCDSNVYIRFSKGDTYDLDLSKYFYDPDSDKLTYSFENTMNLAVKVKGSIASISTKKWYGAEEIVFTADDGNGGTVSKRFFVHVINKKLPFFTELFNTIFY